MNYTQDLEKIEYERELLTKIINYNMKIRAKHFLDFLS